MYEKILLKTSKEMGGKQKKFYRLTRKNKREVYFQNKKEAIRFIKGKFNSIKDPEVKQFQITKKIAYILIKFRILQFFLKEIYLSEKFGEVIYIAEQVKGFNLEKKEVISFPSESKIGNFIKLKEFQKRIAEKGFAPSIFEINKKIPFSREELLIKYEGDEKRIFTKLYKFYKLGEIKEISVKKYSSLLIKLFKKENIKDKFIGNLLESISKISGKVLLVNVHGDFVKDHILMKKDSPVFIDWGLDRKSLICEDIIKYFRKDGKLLKNKKFLKLIKIYPRDVQKNIKLYIILNEISSMIEKKSFNTFKKKEILSIINQKKE